MDKLKELLQLTRDYFLAGIPVMEMLKEVQDKRLREIILKEYMRLDVQLMLRC